MMTKKKSQTFFLFVVSLGFGLLLTKNKIPEKIGEKGINSQFVAFYRLFINLQLQLRLR